MNNRTLTQSSKKINRGTGINECCLGHTSEGTIKLDASCIVEAEHKMMDSYWELWTYILYAILYTLIKLL